MNLLELREAIDKLIKEEPSSQSAIVTVVVNNYTIAVDGVSVVDDAEGRVIGVNYIPVV